MGLAMTAEKLINSLPKTELHLHIEGTLEPELMLKLAEKNNVPIKYKSVEEIRSAYKFKDLQDFLNIYYAGMNTLRTEEDFYTLTDEYLRRAKEDNVQHVEIFFDPQAHMHRGLKFGTVIEGIAHALKDGERKYGITSLIIMSFLRDLSEEDALRTLSEAEPYLDLIAGVGLDSAELGNPPSKFKNVFREARERGLKLVAHAGEEGPAEYVREAVEILKVDRIDHGVRTVEDPALLRDLGEKRYAFTLCPLSNLKLNVIRDLKDYPLREIMRAGVLATINSDDPAYFGGYVNENYLALQDALGLSGNEIITLAKNSVLGSFATESRKEELLEGINRAVERFQ